MGKFNLLDVLVPLATKRQKNGEHLENATDYLKVCNTEVLKACLGKQIEKLEVCIGEEQDAYVVSRSNPYVSKINVAGKQRKKLLSSLFGLGTFAESEDDAKVRESGSTIKKAITTFRRENSEQKVDETGRYRGLIAKLKKNHAADIENISASAVIDKLEAKNEQICVWNDERMKIDAANKGILKAKRTETDKALEDVRQHFLAYIINNGMDDFKDQIKLLNAIAERPDRNNKAKKKKADGAADGKAKNTDKQKDAKNGSKKHDEKADNDKDSKQEKEQNPDNGKTELQPEEGDKPKENEQTQKENAEPTPADNPSPANDNDEGKGELAPAQ